MPNRQRSHDPSRDLSHDSVSHAADLFQTPNLESRESYGNHKVSSETEKSRKSQTYSTVRAVEQELMNWRICTRLSYESESFKSSLARFKNPIGSRNLLRVSKELT